MLAHGLAVQAVRAHGRRDVKVGPAENITAALPAIGTLKNGHAAELATRELNAPYLIVMLEGRYTDAWLAAAGADAPRFTEDELKIVSPRSISLVSTSTPRAPMCRRAMRRRATRSFPCRLPIRA